MPECTVSTRNSAVSSTQRRCPPAMWAGCNLEIQIRNLQNLAPTESRLHRHSACMLLRTLWDPPRFSTFKVIWDQFGQNKDTACISYSQGTFHHKMKIQSPFRVSLIPLMFVWPKNTYWFRSYTSISAFNPNTSHKNLHKISKYKQMKKPVKNWPS